MDHGTKICAKHTFNKNSFLVEHFETKTDDGALKLQDTSVTW